MSPSEYPTGGNSTKLRQSSQPRIVTFSTPSTKWELLQHLRQLLFLTPAAPFSRLLSIHGRYRLLQSVESYNLLLHFSIRHSLSGRTRSLLDSMAANDVQPDEVTEKLVMRHLVSSGHWKTAWLQVMTRYPSVGRIPLPVVLELLAPGTRPFPRLVRTRTNPSLHYQLYSYGQQTVEDMPSNSQVPFDAFLLILQRFPTLALDELAKLSFRVVSYVVRGLIRNGHEGSAVILTKNYLMSLPPDLSPERAGFARDLVHLHLTAGAIKLAVFEKRRRLVEALLSIHPSLRPNAITVFLLMRYLQRSRRCGIEAYLFFRHYREQWGSTIDSVDNRRRIIEYALKQRKHGIAKEIYQLPPLPMDQPEPIAYEPFRIRPWRTIYPRTGKRNWYWRKVFMKYLERKRAWQRNYPSIRWPKHFSKR